MKSLLAALLAVLVVAGAADATTYYVRPGGGSDTGNTGTAWSRAFNSITKANTAAHSGDKVYLCPGTHVGVPAPTNARTGGAFIAYVGAGDSIGTDTGNPITNLALRAKVKVGAFIPSQDYFTLKGVTIASIGDANGNFAPMLAARFDTISYCTVTGDLAWSNGDYSVLDHLAVNGGRAQLGNVGFTYVNGVTLANCTFPNLGKAVLAQPHSFKLTRADSCNLYFNRASIREEQNAIDVSPRAYYYTTRTLFRGNRFDIDCQRAGTGNNYTFLMRLRDSTSYNDFECDTMIATGPGDGIVYMEIDGVSSSNGKTGNTTVDSCYWDLLALGGPSSISWRYQMKDWTIRRSFFAANGRALNLEQGSTGGRAKGTNIFDHNTFVGDPDFGVVSFGYKSDGIPYDKNSVAFTNNIIYATTQPYPSHPELNHDAPVPRYSNDTSSRNWAMYVAYETDSSVSWSTQTRFSAGRNLYAYYGYSDSANGDRSFVSKSDGNVFLHYCSPTHGFADDGSWRNVDATMKYGSPQFADTSKTSFDPHLGANSAAYRSASDSIGGQRADIGAFQRVPSSRIQLESGSTIIFRAGKADTAVVAVSNQGDFPGYAYLPPSCGTLGRLNSQNGFSSSDSPLIAGAAVATINVFHGTSNVTGTFNTFIEWGDDSENCGLECVQCYPLAPNRIPITVTILPASE